jgi:hypothetical protein
MVRSYGASFCTETVGRPVWLPVRTAYEPKTCLEDES